MSLSDKISACSKSFSDRRKSLVDRKALSKSSYIIDNRNEKEFDIIEIDGCVFNSFEKKCDFGMKVANENTIHFIELKGSDNNQGLRQLFQTLMHTKEHYNKYTKKVRLIVTRSEAPRDLDKNTISKIASLVGDVMNGKRSHFIKQNNTYTEYIN